MFYNSAFVIASRGAKPVPIVPISSTRQRLRDSHLSTLMNMNIYIYIFEKK